MPIKQSENHTEIGQGIIPKAEYFLSPELGLAQTWQVYEAADLGNPMILMLDHRVGISFVGRIPYGEYDTAAFNAWRATRHSRAPGHSLEIMKQIVEDGVDPDGKLRHFLEIGHTAPADIAKIQIDMDFLPRHLAHFMFLTSAEHGGQEKSTRYQKSFGKKVLTPSYPYLGAEIPNDIATQIENSYQALGNESISLYVQARDLVNEAFAGYYKITNDKDEQSVLSSRVLDCARVFLLMGQATGMSFTASAREWSRMISILKAMPGNYYPKYADALESFLAPIGEVQEATGYKGEAAQLIRHTEAQVHNIQNMMALDNWLKENTDFSTIIKQHEFGGSREQDVVALPPDIPASFRAVAHLILSVNPTINPITLFGWLGSQSREVIAKISTFMYNQIDAYHELPRMAATTNMSLIFNSTIGVNRDFARHRGGGARFQPVPTWNGIKTNYATAREILNSGYVLPIHLTQIPEFNRLAVKFNEFFERYYTQVDNFVETFHSLLGEQVDYGFILNVLPLGHYIPIWMHFHPGQAAFFPDRRVREGGDNTYRVMAWDANDYLSSMDPMMRGIKFSEDRRPKIASRTEFLDRA